MVVVVVMVEVVVVDRALAMVVVGVLLLDLHLSISRVSRVSLSLHCRESRIATLFGSDRKQKPPCQKSWLSSALHQLARTALG